MGQRLGVLGGTFDPIHVGHLVAAVNARHALGLDKVLMVVANDPWQKSGRPVTAAADRLAVVEAAVAGRDGLEASRIEIDRGGESYTADTLEQLADANPDGELFLIVGTDVAAELGTWRRIEVARRLSTLVVVSRPGATAPELDAGWRVEHVEIPRLEVSASDLRDRARAGLPLDYLVPDGAIELIRRLGLYAGGR
ncbi:MAG: nicotinate-nucleotide adenylyltransferase [Actinomycetota bacterium]|nr:nicotinate-nucleotide adenylyltransferase [Actinomycetota bacterium]